MSKSDDDIIVHRVKRNKSNTKSAKTQGEKPKKPAIEHKSDETQDATKQKLDRQFKRNIKVLSAFITVFAVLLFLALVSYTRADEAFLSIRFRDLMGIIRADQTVISQTGEIHNWLGLFGAYVSNYCYNLTFGYAVIFFPAYLVYWAISLYKYQKISEQVLKNTAVYFILALIFSGIMGLFGKIDWLPNLPQEFSGIVGYYIASILYSIIGGTGGMIFLVVLTGVTLYYGFEFQFTLLRKAVDKVVYSDKDTRSKVMSHISAPFRKISEYAGSVSLAKKEKAGQKEVMTSEQFEDSGDEILQAIPRSGMNMANTDFRRQTPPVPRPVDGGEVSKDVTFSQTARMIRRNVGRVDEVKIDDSKNFDESKTNPSFVAVRNHSVGEKDPQTQPHAQPVINRTYEAFSVPKPSQEPIPPQSKIIIPDIKQPIAEVKEEKSPTEKYFENRINDADSENSSENEYITPDSDEYEPVEVPQTDEAEDDMEIDDDFSENSENEVPEEILPKALRPTIVKPVETAAADTLGKVVETAGVTAAAAGIASEAKPKLELFVNEPVENQIITKIPKCPISTPSLDEKINYNSPTLDLLTEVTEEVKVDEEELKENARILQEKLETFKIYIENLSITPGPVVTQYEFVPAAGIKISKISNLADDIAMALKARGIRIISPIPGKGTVGIEIPNQNPSMVHFSSIIKSVHFHDNHYKLPLALGKTISGEVYITDLAKMPHLLIAGSTGSGKSVGINTIICSLLYKKHPKDLKFVIIDPKKVELNMYSKLSHHYLALSPDIDEQIITEPENAVIVLKALCAEMDLRYDILAKAQQRNISDYNEKVALGQIQDTDDMIFRPMPFIVCVVDELADLMLKAGKDVETPIIRLAQLARAVGIHLVVATQRPSVDVITGIIKANFPARISYLVASKIDSRTILDVMGAEQLLGNGDMLLLAGSPKPVRVQNAFISTDEVEAICDYIGGQKGFSEPYYLPSVQTEQSGKAAIDNSDDRDPLFEEAARLVIRQQVASVSLVQRRLKVGYARAGRIIDELEAAGIVSQFDGSKSRSVYLESEADLEAIL